MTTDTSLDAYAKAAMDHTAGTLEGDSRRANRAYHRLADIYRARRAQGNAAQQELLSLLRHAEPGVRVWAATHALEFSPDRAVPVLERDAAEPGILGFNARTVLAEYRAGRLRFP
jgi:Domain of unknown function (DUF2019)